MPREPLTLKAEAQQVLDELWAEKLIPFALTAGRLPKLLPSTPSIFTIAGYAQPAFT